MNENILGLTNEQLKERNIKEIKVSIDCNTGKRTIEPIYYEL